MSKLETNQVDPATGTTLTLGTSGDTIAIPSGVTIANSGTASGFGGVNTPCFLAYLSANQDVSNEVLTKCAFNTEVYDVGGCYDNSSNYRFTPTTAGKYMIYGKIHMQSPGGYLSYAKNYLKFNGESSYPAMAGIQTYTQEVIDDSGIQVSQILEFDGTDDYVEMFGVGGHNQGDVRFAGVNRYYSFFGGFKIIE